MYDLVIVESPAKAKTIQSYLGSKYKVISSVGHIRDLAKTGPGGLGIDVENNFEAKYTYITGKKKVVNEIKKFSKDANMIYIATDPDREGEAIGWHIADELLLDLSSNCRISFSEITKQGVLNGIKNVRTIDMNLVKSQESRRKIDRILGFKLSKLLQKKIKAKSAGRVQSVALKMIVEREREINSFNPIEYYKINALNNDLTYEWEFNSKKHDLKYTKNIFDSISGFKKLNVIDVNEKNKSYNSKLCYTTSTFQQDCVNRLSFNAKKAMSVAQKLYEGIKINGELQGLITYMRTDSTRLDSGFVKSTMEFIEKNYSKKYVGTYKVTKSKNAQEAHEAIRPTNINLTPDAVKKSLTTEQFKVYELIYKRTVASLMSKMILKTVSYTLECNNVKFKINDTDIVFDGYKRVYDDTKVKFLNLNYKLNDVVEIENIEMSQHFTQPKSRYSEAKLIKELEENGVGRPSTYASIIETIKLRNYVIIEDKRFFPTDEGILVISKLDEFFSEIINSEYTSKMESDLDLIAVNELNDLVVLGNFYEQFIKLMDIAQSNMESIEAEKTGNICPNCDSELVLRKGRYGEFEACGNFPKCKYITPSIVESICKCPECENGNIILKKTKRNKEFYACNNFPTCKYAKWTIEEVKLDLEQNK